MKLNLTNDIGLYAASMGKIFRVTHICDTIEEANAIMEKNRDIGLISQDKRGHLFLAELYGSVCPSVIMEDIRRRA
jgi:hypothetical protein